MKICLISARLYSYSITAGMEALARLIASELPRFGHQVSVITTTPDGTKGLSTEQINGARVYSFRPLNIYERYSGQRPPPMLARLVYNGIDLVWNPLSYRTVKGILAKEKPDVVHVHYWRGFSPSLFDAIKSLGLPLVLTAHDYFLVCPRGGLLRHSGKICTTPLPVCWLYKEAKKLAIDKNTAVVTAPSQFVIDKLREHGFFRDTRAVILPNALYNVIEPDDNQHYRRKNYDVINILFVGQLAMHKGVHILIDAFKQLKYKDIRLHIVGRGEGDERFKGMAGADSRIIFHGFVPQEKLISLYQEGHITVVPSLWYEAFGLIVIESFKYGVPVVASNIGGIPSIIENEYNGLLFEPGNVNELKDRLESLIENLPELKRLSQGAFESAKKYNIDDYMKRLEGLYREVAQLSS